MPRYNAGIISLEIAAFKSPLARSAWHPAITFDHLFLTMTDEQSFSILRTPTGSDRVQKPSGSTIMHSNSSSGGANPRSCVTCRKRKVKCDKKQPCSNCTKARIECVFPNPGRAPRKTRKPPDGELMERLKRLEGVVQTLNAQVEEEQQAHSDEGQRSRQGSHANGEGKCPRGPGSPTVAVDDTVDGLESRFGRLVVDEGRSRYINNSFWASLNNEVCLFLHGCPGISLIYCHRWKISKAYSSTLPTMKTSPTPLQQPQIHTQVTKALYSDTAQRVSVCSIYTLPQIIYQYIGHCSKKMSTPYVKFSTYQQ